MLNKLQNEWRSAIIFILLLLMMITLFVSRAGLSISAGLFVLFCVGTSRPKEIARNFLGSRILIGVTIYWVIVFLSGAWSTDHSSWLDNIRIKLPLLLFPFAFAAPFNFTMQHWKRIGYSFLVIMFIAACWMLVHYLRHREMIDHTYLQARTMWTPLENDHVRFSWLMTLAILVAGMLFWGMNGKRNIRAYLLASVSLFFIILLHLLAARTGLACFYILVIGLAAWLLFKKTSPLKVVGILLVPVLIFVAAWQFFPSFKNRIDYLLYDAGYSMNAHYLAGSTDAVRVISIKTGWELMNQHPVAGVGFGDIAIETNRRYVQQYPGMLASDHILPSSEWMMYGAGAGWPGFIIFFILVLLPFTVRNRWPIGWWMLNAMTGFSFLFDIGLETQFGVFIFTLALLCNWKWMVAEKM